MKKFLTFLTLLTLFTLTAGAGTVTYLMGKDKPGTWTSEGTGKAASITTSDDFTISLGSANVTNANYIAWNAGLNANGQANRFTISHSSYSITEIEVSCTNATLDKVSIADGGGSMTTTDDGFTWSSETGSNSVSFQYASGTGVKQMRISQLVITYEGGSQTTVATPVITLDPASGPYYVGDNVTASIACETEGATLTYSLDNGSTWQTYSSAVSIPSTTAGSVKIIAKAAKDGEEKTAEKTVAFGPSAATVAEILQLSNNTTFRFTGELVVSAVYSTSNIYAQDETGGILIYASNLPYEAGDVIPADFIANRASYGGAPEITNITNYTTATETSELVAEEVEISQIGIDDEQLPYLFKYSVIKNATVTSSTITVGNESVNIFNRFNVTIPTDGKTYDVTGITSYHSNNGAQFIPLSFEETYIDPGEGYYIVGSFCNWKKYEAYRLTDQNGKLVLDANLPAPTDINYGLQFKVVYAEEDKADVWLGAQADGAWYGIDRDHTSVTLVDGSNLRIAAGGQTHFEVTINGDTKTLTVSRNAQAYFKCDKINDWTKVAMTATDNGWTITEQLEAGAKFGFEDEWGTHRGNNWTIKPEHYGDNYNIPLGNENTPIMQDAGYYKIDVNSALSVMHVNKEFAIKCSANPNGGGNVTAKVGGQTATSAMAGETVTIEYTTANGYTFNNITLNGTALEAVEGVYSFTMPNADANVVANFTAQSFAITVVSENGTTTCPATATTSSTVSFTVTPDEGYTVTNVSVAPGNVSVTEEVTENGTIYSFGMPPFPVTVTVTYKAPPAPITIPFVETWDGTVYSEENSGRTGGNDGKWSGSIANGTIVADNEGWEYTHEGGASQCIKLGASKNGGSAKTPNINVTNGTTYKMTFRAGAWNGNSEATTLSLGAEGASLFEDANCETALTEVTTVKGAWTTYTVYVKATAANMNITWYTSAGNNRFFLDDVNIDYITESKTLAEIVALGATADGKKYCINENLLGVKKSTDGKTIWFKDDNKFANPDVCNSTDNNFEMSANGEVWHSKDASFDQSNWIEVVFPEAVNYDENYAKNLTGTYSYNNGNPKLTVTTTVGIEETLYEGTISTNSYMPANFAGSQQGHYTNNGSQVECTYFFVTPKPQEVAKIFYAVYSNGALTMPSNNNGVSGTVTVDMSKNATDFEPENGKVYSNFDVIICIDASSAPAPAPQGAPMLKAQGDNYKVYPVNLTADNDVTTAISTVGVNGEVKSVKYVSVAGVVSDRPFQGVNIVVTEYTDGSHTTTKVVK